MDRPAHALKLSLKMTAVLLCMCVLTSQTCIRLSKPIRSTIHQIQAVINTSLVHLPADGLLSGASCSSLNMTELFGFEELPHSRQVLPKFRCHMVKMSNITREFESQLLKITQLSQDVEELMSERVIHSNCSLPSFEQDKDKYQFVRCLLELLDQVLSSIKP